MFRVIPLPKFIMNDIRVPYEDGNSITEVDGHLVLLAKKLRMPDNAFFTDWIKNNDSSMKMCILYNVKRDTGCGSSTCSDVGDNNNYHWMEDSFLMPPFDWKQEDVDCILPIPRTDLMIVRSSDNACSFYYYNWKKSFSNKFRINGLNLFMNEKASRKPIEELQFWIFEESLLNFAIFCFLLVAWHGYGQINSWNVLPSFVSNSYQGVHSLAVSKFLIVYLAMKILDKLR
ncbi:hypothetical protein MKX01_034786 [Papaver californicum]|nr:hypothetical protein MKX01_034786 [Papaver californicum]